MALFDKTKASISAAQDVLRNFLVKYGKRVINESKPNQKEIYHLGQREFYLANPRFQAALELLQEIQWLELRPSFGGGALIIITPDKEKANWGTVSKRYVRLLKTPYLLMLTPKDFFKLIKLFYYSSYSAVTISSLNLGAAELDSLENSPFYQFFVPLQVGYRLSRAYVGDQWIDTSTLKQMTELPPTKLNQLAAIQRILAEASNTQVQLTEDAAILYE